ncbi:class I SAM-dependent methyltransferase [Prevotella falsenii]|uniref:class I SAM-dependent methyltransferase n=1 Tax=Prevotella falsenii TaxID=515414 RepID=UPI000468A820|nr:methyltransferase domain-containing protein [Prevotella falsenii]
MFWDLVAKYYTFFEKLYNGRVNREICRKVAERISPDDEVLECACGTGMISVHIAAICKSLTATDFSDGMLVQTYKRCKNLDNVRIEKGNILQLNYVDESFDKVIAANVIHLLEHPEIALGELLRVCKKGGEVIIPTYLVNRTWSVSQFFVWFVNRFTKTFIGRFNEKTYKAFFEKLGFTNVSYELIEGRMPCGIAIIKKQDS